ncbi:MAG: radical SAM protein [Candidatus Bathyarchaeota archaeon]|nr:radical SAM protein [Candidatus Bathyarchaeota archaeon]
MRRALSAIPLSGLLAVSFLKLKTAKLRKYSLVVSKTRKRGPPIAMWAITTRCNCRCYFCKVWRKPVIEPTLEQAFGTIDILDRIGCYSLSITGGEPLLYPYLTQVINYAHEKGFIIQINTNGSTLVENISSISGADLVTISLDYSNEEHDKVREHPGLFQKALKGANACRRANMRVDFSTLLLGDQNIVKLVEIARSFNGSLILSYPEVGGSLHADAWELPPKEWLTECFRTAIALKEGGYPIFNTILGLRDAIQYLNSEKRFLPCFAGESIIYIDWDGLVYPCLHETKMCHIKCLEEKHRSFPKFYSCTKCYDQAWLDLSAIEWSLRNSRPDLSFRDLLLVVKIAFKMV